MQYPLCRWPQVRNGILLSTSNNPILSYISITPHILSKGTYPSNLVHHSAAAAARGKMDVAQSHRNGQKMQPMLEILRSVGNFATATTFKVIQQISFMFVRKMVNYVRQTTEWRILFSSFLCLIRKWYQTQRVSFRCRPSAPIGAAHMATARPGNWAAPLSTVTQS